MSEQEQKDLGATLWKIADDLRGIMNADDFRDYMLSFLFLRYLSLNYEEAIKKELSSDYPNLATPYNIATTIEKKEVINARGEKEKKSKLPLL